MSYTKPEDVVSPKEHWKLKRVLRDRGAGGWSVAEGEWDGEPALAIRWNGEGTGKGNPQSHGRPTWFIIPNELAPIMKAALGLMA